MHARRLGAAGMTAMLLACGSGGDDDTSTRLVSADPGLPPEVKVEPEPPCGGFVTLRLRGTNLGSLSALTVETGALAVTAGEPLEVLQQRTLPVELFADGGAPRLGVVRPPAGLVTVSIPIVSATAAGEQVQGPLDACVAPLEFTFDPARVDPARCHVVVELDVARSALPAATEGGSAFLLPQLKVVY